ELLRDAVCAGGEIEGAPGVIRRVLEGIQCGLYSRCVVGDAVAFCSEILHIFPTCHWAGEGLIERAHRVDDIGPAVAVARRDEGGGEVIALQSDLGGVRAVADSECPARASARIGWALDRGETDVSQVESILSGHAGNGARKARRLIQLEDAG